MNGNSTCQIWRTPAIKDSGNGRDGSTIDSPRAGGEYFISGTATQVLQSRDGLFKARLTSWLVEQRRLGDPCLRLIVHKTASSLLLCYVDHHDPAYRWAERRKLERHPTTGAAQLVEVRETVREIGIPRYVEAPAAPKPLLFSGVPG